MGLVSSWGLPCVGSYVESDMVPVVEGQEKSKSQQTTESARTQSRGHQI